MPADVKKQVDSLIEEEMRRSSRKPADYLADFPPLPGPRFEGHPLLAAEYERVKAGAPMQPLDVSRFRLEAPPQAKRSDLGAWRAALDNASAQLEHQGARIANLELLLKYGDKAWRAQASHAEAAVRALEREVAAARARTQELNQQRKLGQTVAGSELRKAGEEYYALCAKNVQITAACDALEAEVDALKASLGMAAGTAGAAAGSNGTAHAGEGQPPQGGDAMEE